MPLVLCWRWVVTEVEYLHEGSLAFGTIPLSTFWKENIEGSSPIRCVRSMNTSKIPLSDEALTILGGCRCPQLASNWTSLSFRSSQYIIDRAI